MIAVTMGDPAGIGPEIIIKSLPRGSCRRAGGGGGLRQTLQRILR
jgi:4-hydroxy-L-threonine phosphate dehydrogenase PdxA